MTVTFENSQDEKICRALLEIAVLQKQWFSIDDVHVPVSLLRHLQHRGYLNGYLAINRKAYIMTDAGRKLAVLVQRILQF